MKRSVVHIGVLLSLLAALVFATPVLAENPAVAAFVPQPLLNPVVEHLFGGEFRLLGPVTVSPPAQVQSIPHLNTRDPIFLNVPVAFKRTARLDVPLSFPWADSTMTMRVGTMLFYEEFPKGPAEAKIGMWCFLIPWRRYGISHYDIKCLAKNADGKGVFYAGMYGPNGYTVDDVKGGYNAVQWYAFDYYKDEPSAPFDYPALTEMDEPQPDMAIQLRIASPERGKPLARAQWVLRGPYGDIPSTGQLMEKSLSVMGSSITADLGAVVLSATLDEGTKALTNVQITTKPAK